MIPPIAARALKSLPYAAASATASVGSCGGEVNRSSKPSIACPDSAARTLRKSTNREAAWRKYMEYLRAIRRDEWRVIVMLDHDALRRTSLLTASAGPSGMATARERYDDPGRQVATPIQHHTRPILVRHDAVSQTREHSGDYALW